MADQKNAGPVKSYPMVAGDGAHSYAKNSSYQKGAVDAAKELTNEAIDEKLDLKVLGFDTSKVFRIADMGCSVGPNTYFAVQNIIEAVESKFHAEHQNPSAIDFQVFFNDHDGNDFNTLFKNLPHSRRYFAAGVPGSFHGRLLPKSTIHFVHSSYALHWLSKVPKELVNGNSIVSNKGTIQTRRFVKEVAEAYSAQFTNDMESFLNARAQELVPGGLMIILMGAVPDGIPLYNTAPGALYDVLGSCLIDLAKTGVITEEKVDSFNLPVYNATPKELEALLKRNEYFNIERIENLINPSTHTTMSAKGYTSGARAVTEELIKEHFGDEFVDQIFNHFTTKVEENLSIIEEKTRLIVNLFILLQRTIN